MKRPKSAADTTEASSGPRTKAIAEVDMGEQSSKGAGKGAQTGGYKNPVVPTPADLAEVPPFFAEILVELTKLQGEFGGVTNFRGSPKILQKVRREDFSSSYTDYEYIYLTILGFGILHANCEEIVRKNNGEDHQRNPGVHMLEHLCGMTMHGNREGANNVLRTAPATLLEAFQIAKTKRNGMREFFKDAFDRTADPCLEGRIGRLMEYLEAQGTCGSSGIPPWEDVSLRTLPPGTPVRDVVGEHLRVFLGECVWAWSQQHGMTYVEAKSSRSEPRWADNFAKVFNAATFEAALVSKGVAANPESEPPKQWEAKGDGTSWNPYDEDTNMKIERARLQGQQLVQVQFGEKRWRYEIDLVKMVQRNPKTFKERPLRAVAKTLASGSGPVKGMPLEEIRKEIRYFVELCTLPAAP